MPLQDRTGDNYEKILASSLDSLGYKFEETVGSNYLQPPKRTRAVIIPGTYIQPDLVVRENSCIRAVIYSTHWSNTRDSKRKFWRTWEESVQQKLAVDYSLIEINCIFESLPNDSDPSIHINSDSLQKDSKREALRPIQLN